jgi:mannose-binding lectin 1
MTNDGTKQYDHHRDGITQQLGGCLRDFRNKPFAIALKIEYYKRVLTIYYHNGLSANDRTYSEICARVENLDLPRNGHFGVSAATGGLADDHDVMEFLTYSLVDNNSPNNIPNPEQKKYDDEYQQFLRQLEQEKEKYNQAHPEEHQQEIDEKRNFESESDRQFRTILDVQNSIHHSIRLLDSKFAEVLGRQERIVSMLATGGIPNQQQQQQQTNNNQGQVHQIDTFNRMEVNQVMNQQNELVRSVRDIL